MNDDKQYIQFLQNKNQKLKDENKALEEKDSF